MSVFEVHCGPRNGRPNRLVVLRDANGGEFRDCLDTDSAFHRETMLRRAAQRFGVQLDPNDVADLDSRLVQAADAEDEKADKQANEITYATLTGQQLDAQNYSIEYLVPGILAAGQHTLLGGPHKALKTLTACDLAIALTLGGRFLGHFKTTRAAKTAIMSGECGWPVLQQYLRRIARAAGSDLGQLPGILVSTDLPKFNVLHADAMAKYLTDNELEVVILDCAYLMGMGDDAANVFRMGELLRTLGDVFVDANATMVLLHHATKGAGGDGQPIELENLSFAGFREFAAQWLLVSRRTKYEPGTGHHELWLSSGGRAGHSGRWALTVEEGAYDPNDATARQWAVSVTAATEARAEAEREKENRKALDQERRDGEHREKLLAVLRDLPSGETERALRPLCRLNPDKLGRALHTLRQEGRVEPCQVTKGKTSYDGWRLVRKP
jgi:hypothetical protein